MMFKTFGTLCCIALWLPLVGCSSDKGSDSKEKKTSAAKGDEPTWAMFATDAPAIDFDSEAEVPPLDNGRLNIKVLEGWKETNQKRPGMLFIYLKGGKPSPSLLVHKPDDAGDVKELDEASKSGYLTTYAAALPDNLKKNFITKPKLIDINGRPWILYSVGMSSSGNKIEVTYLSTVANGRKYTLEMRTADKKANHDWPALLSMAKGMSFGGKAAEPMTPTEEPKKPDAEKTEPAKDEAAKEPAAEK
jgi:hypothetical protein